MYVLRIETLWDVDITVRTITDPSFWSCAFVSSSYDGNWWQMAGRVKDGPGRTFEADARPKQKTRMPQPPLRRPSLAVFLLRLYREQKIFLLLYSSRLNGFARASAERVMLFGNAYFRRLQVSGYECSVRVVIGPVGDGIITECSRMLEVLIIDVRMSFFTWKRRGREGDKKHK